MDNNKHKVQDAAWQAVEEDTGQINFRRDKKKQRINMFLKGIMFVLIASISGTVSALYVVNKRAPKYGYTQNNLGNKSIFEQNTSENQTLNTSENSIAKVAETVGPAVVGISNKGEGLFYEINQDSGSGIIFQQDGYIVTNNHVIDGADKLTVKLSGGKTLNAVVVGADPRSDIAVIKVNAADLPVAKFGDSSNVKVGETAIAIGNPLGEEFAGSVTAGIISAVNRKIKLQTNDGSNTIYKVIQTDAAINPGNSGGALCNIDGEVIGINSLKFGASENVEGMGFAISVNEVKNIISEIMKHGKVSVPVIGINATDAVAEGKDSINGAYVQEVYQGTGAAVGKIRPTDIITGLDNVKINNKSDLQEIISKHKVGDAVPCKIWRDGKSMNLVIILTEKKDNKLVDEE